MRIRTFVVAALSVLAVASTAFAQEYIQYVNRDDRFTIEFPTQPKVTATTFMSQYGYSLPAHVYESDATGIARGTYKITVGSDSIDVGNLVYQTRTGLAVNDSLTTVRGVLYKDHGIWTLEPRAAADVVKQ